MQYGNKDDGLFEAFLKFGLGVLVMFAVSKALAQEQPSATAGESSVSYDELTRGPVHEAFAEQVSLEARPGIVIPESPPEPIKELPPENRPADASAVWIGGYWAYSDAESDEAEAKGDFIWVSGVWRIPPRGHQWVPGYWAKVEDGFQWIGGFWAADDRTELSYLPEPPDTLEEGPTSRAPSDAHFWVPGAWRYQENDYVWRPGYWAASNDRYVWIPEYYRWTPRGHVHCGGYWDHSLTSRGFLFAPVQFHQPVYARQGFAYRPSVVVDLGPLQFHLFVRPSYSHYYFGDYYGDRYANHGYYAWHNYYTRRHSYDPLFTYNAVRYGRRGVDFHDRISKWHHWFHDHEEMRPRHTYAQQQRFAEKHRDRDDLKTVFLGNSFQDVVRDRRGAFVDFDERRGDFDSLGERFSQLRKQRHDTERGDTERDDDREERLGDSREGRADRDQRGSLDLRGFGRNQARTDRDGDAVRALRPNLDRDEQTRERGNAATTQPGERLDRQPRVTPDNFGERIGRDSDGDRDRDDDARPRVAVPKSSDNQPRTQQPRDDRSPRPADGPRFDDSPTIRREQPERKPSAGGLIRPDKDPRGDTRFSPPPDRSKFLPTPGSVRPGDNVPNNARQGADVKGGGDFQTQPDSPAITPDGTRQLPFNQRRDAASPRPSREPAVDRTTPPTRRELSPPSGKTTQPPARSTQSTRERQGQSAPAFRPQPRSQPQAAPSRGGGGNSAKPSGKSNGSSKSKKSKD